ncbi:MAG: hypothetical protein ACLRIT_10120 [Blautia sp.]
MEKGFKTLELIGDLDDKYIYEASQTMEKNSIVFSIYKGVGKQQSPGSYCLLWLDAH